VERRAFMGMLVGGLLVAPIVAEGQPARTAYRIGKLYGGDPGGLGAALLQGLRELGYTEGQNIVFERRSADGRPDRLPGLAAELVHLKVDVIVTSGPDAIRAAQRASRTIPIVAAIMHEPVAFGFVASYARPGSNITGLAFQDSDLTTKRLQLLKETLPGLFHVAALFDPNAGGLTALNRAQEAARLLGFTLQALEVKSPPDLTRAFDAARRKQAQALLQLASPFFSAHRREISDLAIQNRIPATCEQRMFVQAGCLMSYGPDFNDMFRRSASFVDKILKGAKPAVLPIEEPTKFELVINLKTAKALGLTIPPSLLARADEVIQ